MTVEVSSWTDLDAIRDDLSGDYVLTTDLDSNDGDYAGIGDDFEPIGGATDSTWTFDGQGHAIRDLVINSDRERVGFAGEVGDLRNLLLDADVTGTRDVFGDVFIGLLVGQARGTVENCFATGEVSGINSDDVRTAYAGGLVGESVGAQIRSCGTDATVSDADAHGGACGQHRGSGLIKGCYTLGSVEAALETAAGFCDSNDAEIQECWSAATVAEGSGFVRFSTGEELDCFWDSDVGPDTTGGDATGLSTSEMQGLGVETTMSPLRYVADFSRVVGGDNADADGYPMLRSIPIAPQDDAQTASIADYRAVVRDLTAAGVDDDGPAVGLSWSDRAAGEDLFRVYRTDGDSGAFPDDFTTVIETDPETESATDSDLPEDTTFSYRVVAVEDSVESDPTDADPVTTPTGEFVVEIVGTNSPVGVGETLELDVEVTNQGGASGETTVEADLTEQ